MEKVGKASSTSRPHLYIRSTYSSIASPDLPWTAHGSSFGELCPGWPTWHVSSITAALTETPQRHTTQLATVLDIPAPACRPQTPVRRATQAAAAPAGRRTVAHRRAVLS